MAKSTDAQKRASVKWRDENRERARYTNARSAARGFIRNRAKINDLYELREIIDTKILALNGENNEQDNE